MISTLHSLVRSNRSNTMHMTDRLHTPAPSKVNTQPKRRICKNPDSRQYPFTRHKAFPRMQHKDSRSHYFHNRWAHFQRCSSWIIIPLCQSSSFKKECKPISSKEYSPQAFPMSHHPNPPQPNGSLPHERAAAVPRDSESIHLIL